MAVAVFYYSCKQFQGYHKKKPADLTSDQLLLNGGICFHPQTDISFCSAACCAVALVREDPEACRRQKTQASLPRATRETHKFAKRS